jgi:hypothetical protein
LFSGLFLEIFSKYGKSKTIKKLERENLNVSSNSIGNLE